MYSNTRNKTLINKLVVFWLGRWLGHNTLFVSTYLGRSRLSTDSSPVLFLYERLVLLYCLSYLKQHHAVKFLQAAEIGTCPNTCFPFSRFHLGKNSHFSKMAGVALPTYNAAMESKSLTPTVIATVSGTECWKLPTGRYRAGPPAFITSPNPSSSVKKVYLLTLQVKKLGHSKFK